MVEILDTDTVINESRIGRCRSWSRFGALILLVDASTPNHRYIAPAIAGIPSFARCLGWILRRQNRDCSSATYSSRRFPNVRPQARAVACIIAFGLTAL